MLRKNIMAVRSLMAWFSSPEFHPDGLGSHEVDLRFIAAAVAFLLHDFILQPRSVGKTAHLGPIAAGHTGGGGDRDG